MLLDDRATNLTANTIPRNSWTEEERNAINRERRVIPDGATRARFNEPSRVVETKSAGNGITSSSLGRF